MHHNTKCIIMQCTTWWIIMHSNTLHLCAMQCSACLHSVQKVFGTIWWIIMQCLLMYITFLYISPQCSKGMDIIWWSDPHQQRRIINSERSMQWGWKSISSNNRRKANIQTSKREVWGNACPLVHMTPLFGPSSHTRVTSSK